MFIGTPIHSDVKMKTGIGVLPYGNDNHRETHGQLGSCIVGYVPHQVKTALQHW